MRNLLMTLFFILTCWPVFSQINDNSSFYNGDYDRAFIRGHKIKTVTVNMYALDSVYSKWIHSFDPAGLLTSTSRYARSGDLAEMFNYTYNIYGDPKTKETINYETGRSETIVYNKKYDHSRLIKDSSSFVPVNYEYEYDSSGNLIKIIIRDNVWGKSGKVIHRTYRKDGRLERVKEMKFQSPLYDSVVLSDKKLSYNKAGRIKAERESIGPGKYGLGNAGSVTYKYNKKGDLVEIRKTRGRSCKMNYDVKGLMISLWLIQKVNDGKVEVHDVFSYDVYD